MLCLGLLYHVSKPFELMERIVAWNTDLLVVDTTLDEKDGAYFRIVSRTSATPDRRSIVRWRFAPDELARCICLAAPHGYRAVMLHPGSPTGRGTSAIGPAPDERSSAQSRRRSAGLDIERVPKAPAGPWILRAAARLRARVRRPARRGA